MEEKICSCCGAVIPRGQAHELDGEVLCGHCRETKTAVCEDCGARIWCRDDYGD